jgi:hypothetical protein
LFFEWDAAQCNINRSAVRHFRQQYASGERTLCGIRTSWLEETEEFLDILGVIRKSGKNRQVKVSSKPVLSPSLNRDPSDETELSVLILQKLLEQLGRDEKLLHRLPFALSTIL